ncbi:MAG: MbnP family copper-binding protein [Stutzerimonas sp.]|jgi:uncharacterized repeat protein (TIGR04052 family)|uniref:MbnP family copper-binding protein n=1 Tax=Stutzerimonas sp. TaxID=2901166 RepID=UPI003D0D7167
MSLLSVLAATVVAATPAQPVEIRFEGVVGSQPFRCGNSYPGIGSPTATVRPTDFRFYVTGVSLVDRRGRKVPVMLDQDGLWQYRDVAMIDFEDGSGPCRGGNPGLNLSIKGMVPKGRYTSIAFEIGLPPDLNHGDAATAPVPLGYTSMFWAWRSGYRFFKIDMETSREGSSGPGKASGFSIHIGSTGCGEGSSTTPPPEPCKQNNRIPVSFTKFDPTRDVVSVDLAELMKGTDATMNTPGTAPGCMSAQDDPECRGVFSAFGLPWAGNPAGPNRAFRKN